MQQQRLNSRYNSGGQTSAESQRSSIYIRLANSVVPHGQPNKRIDTAYSQKLDSQVVYDRAWYCAKCAF